MYYQLLMLASFLLAGYQDAREQLVSDYYWIPGIIGAASLNSQFEIDREDQRVIGDADLSHTKVA